MIKEKLSGGTFKHIEGEIYDYHESKRELDQLREDILFSPSGVKNAAYVKDPTGEKAVNMIIHRRISHLEKVTEAIYSVYEKLPERKKRLVHFLYWNRPQQYTWEGIAQQLYISKRQAQRWRKTFVEDIAKRLGWR